MPYYAGESMVDSSNLPSTSGFAVEPEDNQVEAVAEHTKGTAEQAVEQADGVAKPATNGTADDRQAPSPWL